MEENIQDIERLSFEEFSVRYPELAIDPRTKSRDIERLRSIGFSNAFISSLLYPSGRPKVNMSEYKNYYPGRKLSHYNNPYYVCNEEDGIIKDVTIPVLRYQDGMSGYFTRITKQEFCGTFYYFEPESDYYLNADSVMVTWNKITAASELGIKPEVITALIIEKVMKTTLDENENIVENTPRRAGYPVDTWDEVVRGYINHNINPTIHYHEFYAAEDGLDQLICLRAKTQCVCFKYMTGETRVVTEILDTRSRRMSLISLTKN